MLTKFLRGAAGNQGDTLEFVASFTNTSSANTSTGTIPASTQAGDLIIYWDYVPNHTSGAQPSGFTSLNLGTAGAVEARVSYKIAVSGDAGATVTGATGSDYAVVILVFRASKVIATATGVSWSSSTSSGVTQSDTIPSTGYHVWLVSSSSRGGVPTPAFTSQSPTLDGTVATGGEDESLSVGYGLFVNDGTTQSATVTNSGSRFISQAGYITLTV
jgi:hypothetical protein